MESDPIELQFSLDLPAVVRPVQKRLTLPTTAVQVARLACATHLRDVPRDLPGTPK